MAWRYLVILSLVLSACAQVGSVSGGPEDEVAPVPRSIDPPNETVHFQGNRIEMEFDDFVKLNNPNQTISVIPPHFKVKAEIIGKTLTLQWEEPLQPNTTYSIYLNKTVQDITEGNDSLMQLVFSTGDFIDSLTYSTFVSDARTLNPVKGALVGLFEHPDSLKPTYFAETNAAGMAELRYLKRGTYYVRAFMDDNKDLTITKTEQIGFVETPVEILEPAVDSVPMRLFSPQRNPDLRTAQFQSPGMIVAGANRSLENAAFSFNGIPVDSAHMRYLAPDSLLLFVQPSEEIVQLLTVQSEPLTDTVKLRLTESQKNRAFPVVAPKGNFVVAGKELRFAVSDLITAVDTSLIQLVNPADTSSIQQYSWRIEQNEWVIDTRSFPSEKVLFSFESGAIQGACGTANLRNTVTITLRPEKEFGTLNLDLSQYQEPLILELLRNNVRERRLVIASPGTERIELLEPGEYTFRIVRDRNGNGLWDTGNFPERAQPEEILLFSQPTKVRANWEISAELIPQP